MYKGILSACIPVHHVCAWCQQKPEEYVRCPGTEVTGIVSCHVDAGDQTDLLEECSLSLTHITDLFLFVLKNTLENCL